MMDIAAAEAAGTNLYQDVGVTHFGHFNIKNLDARLSLCLDHSFHIDLSC